MRVRDVHIDAQHLAEQFRQVLRPMVGIVARTAVTGADVQEAIGTKREIPAVVIGERLLDDRRPAGAAPSQIETRRRIRDDRASRSAETRHHSVARLIREVHEESPAVRIRGKGQTEQPAFAARRDLPRQIQKVIGQDHTVPHDPDVAVLLNDELDTAIDRILDERNRCGEPGGVHAGAQLRMHRRTSEKHSAQNQRERHRPSAPHAIS
jgi:hypothetical protein